VPTSQDIIDRAYAKCIKEPLHSQIKTHVAEVEVSDPVKTRAWGKVFPGDPVPGVDPGPPDPTPGITFTQSLQFKEVDDFGTIYHDFEDSMDGDLLIDLILRIRWMVTC